jgi:hypothetical protein
MFWCDEVMHMLIMRYILEHRPRPLWNSNEVGEVGAKSHPLGHDAYTAHAQATIPIYTCDAPRAYRPTVPSKPGSSTCGCMLMVTLCGCLVFLYWEFGRLTCLPQITQRTFWGPRQLAWNWLFQCLVPDFWVRKHHPRVIKQVSGLLWTSPICQMYYFAL